MSVYIQGAHTADTLAAVMVEYNRLFALVHQPLVQNIQHLQERYALVDVIHWVSLEMSLFLRTFLTPNLQCYIYIFIHLILIFVCKLITSCSYVSAEQQTHNSAALSASPDPCRRPGTPSKIHT